MFVTTIVWWVPVVIICVGLFRAAKRQAGAERRVLFITFGVGIVAALAPLYSFPQLMKVLNGGWLLVAGAALAAAYAGSTRWLLISAVTCAAGAAVVGDAVDARVGGLTDEATGALAGTAVWSLFIGAHAMTGLALPAKRQGG